MHNAKAAYDTGSRQNAMTSSTTATPIHGMCKASPMW